MASKLDTFCAYAKGKIAVERLNAQTYISTENMMPNKGGIVDASSLPSVQYTQQYLKGDVLVSNIRPYFKKIWIAEYDGGCSNDVLVFRANSSCDPTFLYYVLANDAFFDYATATSKGTKMPRGDKTAIMQYDVPDFDMGTQLRIGKLLRSLDDRITTNKRINDNLQQQAVAIFRQWFSVNPESEKWPVVTLDRLTLLISRGIAPKYDDDSTQIVLNQKCIRDHYIDTLQARRHKPKVINEKWLQYGDLLINSTGEGTLGRAAQVWFVPENMTVDSHVTIIRPQNQLLLFYIGLWGISHEREIEALHTGSTGQTELPRDRVKAMELRLPDNDTLTRFNDVIAPMVSAIVVNQQENARLASVRDALLPKLMSGEIDVSEIDI